MSVRLAQISDLHLPLWPMRWRKQDYHIKRLAGWLNMRWLFRRDSFALAETVAEALVRDIRQRQPHVVVLCGDVACLGFDEEFALAARLLRPLLETFPGVAVPGNHDYYLDDPACAGSFERHFAPWQCGLRIEQGVYPFALVLENLVLLAVNSAKPMKWPWDVRGEIGTQQLKHLQALLTRSEIRSRPCFLVTHYPLLRSDGRAETYFRRLTDAEALAEVLARHHVLAWLHGHRHHPYVHAPDIHRGFALLCCGSATLRRVWSYFELEWHEHRLQLKRRCYWLATREFVEVSQSELVLTLGP
ncbi:MAG: metallophosphoesterase [Gemmatales bacterium]|nr:metallophosphoesterase [Gemmatales bacterium]MCS7161108.1 metallophosphoesterase [Gemmatales bacterium]MDW8176311.1 metallophosphoesterase [Gemmatales bacterium]MDW8221748.1 metallophosphoesterase [Gemmatales bacterium]